MGWEEEESKETGVWLWWDMQSRRFNLACPPDLHSLRSLSHSRLPHTPPPAFRHRTVQPFL